MKQGKNAFPRTTVPMSMSKTQKVQTGGHGHGLGNSVCHHARGFNLMEDKMAVRMDEEQKGDERRKRYLNVRKLLKEQQARIAVQRSSKTTNQDHDAREDADVPQKQNLDIDWFLAYNSGKTPMSQNDYGIKYNKNKREQ